MNRIGLHVINGTSLPLANGKAKPRICLLMDVSVDYYKKVRAQVGDNCVIFIRWWSAEQPLNSPYDNAQNWIALHKADILAMKHPKTVFVGYNEIADSSAVPYAEVEYWRGQLLHSLGANCGYLASSVGTPNENVWPIHQKWLNDMRNGDYVCTHEYASDLADVDNRWHCGRWTLIPQLKDKPIAITEWGFDYTPDTGKGQPGWKRTVDANTFYTANVKYNELLKLYPNVVGAVIFQNGSPDPQWGYFDPAPIWSRIVGAYKEETVETPAPATKPFAVDGRFMTSTEFMKHAASLSLKGKYNRVFIHHTANPDEFTWDNWGGWEYWKNQLVKYYRDTRGWDCGPHLFVDQKGVGLLTPLTQDGIGVASNNVGSRHIEIVGNFMTRVPDGERLANAVTAAATLLREGGLTTDALKYHRQYQSDTSCPGDSFVAKWAWFVGLVAARLRVLSGTTEEEVHKALGAEMQKHIIPLNPTAALERFGATYGMLPASEEFDLKIGDKTYRCQAYRQAGERQWQYGIYAEVGVWDNVKVFKRAN